MMQSFSDETMVVRKGVTYQSLIDEVSARRRVHTAAQRAFKIAKAADVRCDYLTIDDILFGCI
jgi:hypothetical protein